MHYIKIFLLTMLFLSCQKETSKEEIKPKDYSSYLKEAKAAAREICKDRFTAFGCAGHASKIKPLKLSKMAKKY